MATTLRDDETLQGGTLAHVKAHIARIEKRSEELHWQVTKLVKERNALLAALVDLEFIFEGQEDIKDGPEGQQLPNDAMKALIVIRRALCGEYQ